ncbi:hypothetical protein GCM10009610_71050 [Pseudonocardia xinjiangensis]|nr:hypothetical protein [Pseudonocardia xinjiangensis]
MPGARCRAGNDCLAVEGEDVEHHIGRRHGEGQFPSSRIGRVQPPLQRGEVHPALVPENQLTIQHHIDVQLADGTDDLGKVPTQRALLTRLQRDPIHAAVGEAANKRIVD